MNSGYRDGVKDLDNVELINTKENIEKLKFDDKKWNLPEDSFIIYGEENFFEIEFK